jgi:TonB family protein
MDAFSLYLLKSVTWLTGFAVVFFLFLRNERFFLLNRIYLIAGILTSLLFPFISFHYTVVLPLVRSIQADEAALSGIQNGGNGIIPVIQLILLTIYLSGVLIVLVLIIRQCRSVFRVIRTAEIISLQPVKLIRTTDYTSSFSFFSWVFVNPSITDLETREIVNHELVHIRQKHWFDLVLVELLCILQWFNPLAWIYFRFIRQNHEYLADEVALQRTSDPAIYRAALLNQIVGAPVVSLANSFNYSVNKKRFNMMKKIINSPYRKLKILLILPVFAIVLYSFAKPEYRYIYKEENTGNNDPALDVQAIEVKGTVVQQDGKPLVGATVMLRGTTVGVVSDNKGYFRLENVSDDGLLVVTFVGFKSKVIKPVFTSEMTIQMMRDTIKYLNSNISTPPPPPPPPPPPSTNSGNNMNTNSTLPPAGDQKDRTIVSPPLAQTGFKIRGDGSKPLYVLDGNIITQEELDKIDPQSIESINVYKSESAIAWYGDKAKDGVIEITTKKVAGPLVLIDGVPGDLKSIDPDMIQSMNVLKDNSATAQYGEKGKNGVIEIITKKSGSGTKTNTSDKKETAFVVVEELPQFPGEGNEAMTAWITGNLKYPGEAVKSKTTGTVYVDFMVSSTGKVKNVVVSKPVNPLLDAEAKRLIKSMPDWKPGSQAGKPVDVQMMVPVEFKLQ